MASVHIFTESYEMDPGGRLVVEKKTTLNQQRLPTHNRIDTQYAIDQSVRLALSISDHMDSLIDEEEK
jgi:hypothetical protein